MRFVAAFAVALCCVHFTGSFLFGQQEDLDEEEKLNIHHYLSYDSGDAKSGTKGYGTGLDLSETEATDEDLKQLAQSAFRRIRYLNLRGTSVTDQGLAHLKGLPIKTLVLEETEVTGEGFRHLRGLPLHTLILENSSVTNEGLKNLKGLSITTLDLTRTQITDQGLPNLRGLPLDSLVLYSTQITDGGFQYLVDLPVKKLFLTGAQVTDEGVETFKRRSPHIAVIY